MNEVSRCFVEFMALAEPRAGSLLRALHTDGGGEYVITEFSNFPEDRGMASRQMCAYIPQQKRDRRANESCSS